MTVKIIKKIVNRTILSENWGQEADLIKEENFSIQEYVINAKDEIKINLENENIYFILVSGSAEFNFNNEKRLLFKGEKIDFNSENESLPIIITNCGVIPLVFIKIKLNLN